MKNITLLSLFLLLVSCNNKEQLEMLHNETTDFYRIKPQAEPKPQETALKEVMILDTVGLKKFWAGFQKDIFSANKQGVANRLDYPVRAIHPVIFKYSYSCDTIAYIKDEEKYADVDIYKSDMPRCFDFIFDDVLKNIISRISYEDLLQKGHRNKEVNAISYHIFPKDYMKVPCPNDHNMQFYLHEENGKWSISIGGL
ncbi:hypothetical protein [Flavobacterium beibuense]|uniref:Lipoprotein n=1 Tax=Flavobacterium beibuense TaxID=657326 RepID=A0A444WFK3_9FLAO|nr:hypothetical protein [Flavobacterium beibuense]RYJ44575.1 hypothetical protein NU09_1185 [Flavobacterium beibuense]